MRRIDLVAPFAASALAMTMLGMASVAQAATLSVTGNLPRNPSEEIAFTIEIDAINDTQRAAITADEDQNPLNNLQVTITAPDIGTDLPFTAETAVAPSYLYLDTTADPLIAQDDTDDLTKDTFYVVIREGVNGGGKLAEYFTNVTSMTVQISYVFGDTKVISEKTAQLTRKNYVIKDAPAFQDKAIEGTQKALKVFWTHRTDVAVQGEGSAVEPSDINIYYIARDAANSLTLPAKTFVAGNNTQDTAAECEYTAPASATGTCIVCPADTYLDAAKIKEQAAVSVVTAKSSAQARKITGLQNDAQYVVFMQWEPGGLGVSQCIVGTPEANATMTEINGEGDASSVDFRCFIATAAYGTPLHQDLDLFRRFRDDVLMTSPLGRAAVAGYYRWSPPMADFIAEHPWLKASVRTVLEGVADLLRVEEETR